MVRSIRPSPLPFTSVLPNFFAHRSVRAVRSLALLGATVFCVSNSAVLLRQQAELVQDVQTTVLPAAAQLPALERRIAILQEQVDAAEMERAMKGGVTEERERAFVAPPTLERERLLHLFDVLQTVLQTHKTLTSMSSITIGDPTPLSGTPTGMTLNGVPISLSVQGTAEGIHDFLSVIRFSGTVTVGDVLSPRDTQLLLSLTEQENPAAVTSLEQFLDSDLFFYLQEPRSAEEQLLKSFTSPSFETALQAATSGDDMREARRVFAGPLGEALAKERLWPLPLLRLDSAEQKTLEDGSLQLTVQLTTLVRDTGETDAAGQ